MAVRRIMANLAFDRIDAARAFSGDVLGMNIAMDLGWITTFTAEGSMTPQIGVMPEGPCPTSPSRSMIYPTFIGR